MPKPFENELEMVAMPRTLEWKAPKFLDEGDRYGLRNCISFCWRYIKKCKIFIFFIQSYNK